MWNPASPTRRALALSMAAAVAFLGSGILLKAGRVLPQLTGEGSAAGQPGTLLLVVVILLGATGVLLVVMAGRELLAQRRRSRAR